MDTIRNFYNLMNDIQKHSDASFSGLGLIVYNNLESLSIASLKKANRDITLPIKEYSDIISTLVSVSQQSNKFHDGFHLLNQKLELTHLSQYVVAPISSDVEILEEFGSRYRTAIYASLLPNVICSGVLSLNYPITVFQRGRKI